jgi:hypothetical protein
MEEEAASPPPGQGELISELWVLAPEWKSSRTFPTAWYAGLLALSWVAALVAFVRRLFGGIVAVSGPRDK